MTRRTFMASAAAAQAAGAAKPLGIALGIDAYSVRAFRWKALELIDYAARLGLDSLQLSVEEFESEEPGHLTKVKEHAARQGIGVDTAIGSICPTSKSWNAKNGTPEAYVRRGLRATRGVGAKGMRVFIGSRAERDGPLPVEAHLESTLGVLRAVRSEAVDAGVRIAIENHNGDVTARELRQLIETAGKEYTGACLDFGNPMWVLEDPALTLEVLGPVAVTTHMRDSALCEHPRGAQFQWVALGDGSMDLAGLLGRFHTVCPAVAVELEVITGRPPTVLPYLEAGFWKRFPKLPAADFARFVGLAKQGHAYAGPMVIGGEGPQPAEYEAALKQQQRVDLERSVGYARGILGLGLRGRG